MAEETDIKIPKESVEKDAELDQPIVQWKAPKFIYYKKDARWYGAVIGGAVLLLALAWWLRNDLQVSIWLMAPVIVLSAIILISQSVTKPPVVEYGIAESGVLIEGNLRPFADFRAFSIVDMDNHYVLRLWPHLRYYLPTSIIVEEIVPEDLKELLKEVLPEGDHEATLADWIAHFTKF